LYFLVLERTESNLSKINWLRGIIRLHFNSVCVLEHVLIVSHSYQTSFGFLRSDLNNITPIYLLMIGGNDPIEIYGNLRDYTKTYGVCPEVICREENLMI
jgi:hypothetical protein